MVPFIFVLDPAGVALLLKAPPETTWLHTAWIAFTACVGIAALACGVQGWLLRACSLVERAVLIVAGLLLIYPASFSDVIGFAGTFVVLAVQFWRRRSQPAASG